MQLGYSKMLPQIALGHSQSSILNTAYFENEILKLHEVMIPNLMSSTMSGDLLLGNKEQTNTSKKQVNLDYIAKNDISKLTQTKSAKITKTIIVYFDIRY